MKDARNEFRKIMESAVDRTALALFQEIEAILDRLEYDDGFSVETPKVISLFWVNDNSCLRINL